MRGLLRSMGRVLLLRLTRGAIVLLRGSIIIKNDLYLFIFKISIKVNNFCIFTIREFALSTKNDRMSHTKDFIVQMES